MSMIVLPDDLIEKLQEISLRENRPVDEIVAALLIQYQSEADWEEAILDEVIGSAVKPDGSIDFDRLRSTGVTMTLDDLYSESDRLDEA